MRQAARGLEEVLTVSTVVRQLTHVPLLQDNRGSMRACVTRNGQRVFFRTLVLVPDLNYRQRGEGTIHVRNG